MVIRTVISINFWAACAFDVCGCVFELRIVRIFFIPKFSSTLPHPLAEDLWDELYDFFHGFLSIFLFWEVWILFIYYRRKSALN